MFQNNRELYRSLTVLAVSSGILAVLGFCVSLFAGILTLLAGLTGLAVFLVTERYRYGKLQRLSADLERLLISGTPLPIAEYQEGELSILANQVQKLTLRLTESAELVRADKKQLADALADITSNILQK